MALSDFDEDILNDFLTESLELIDELDGDLVSLEENAEDSELLNRIFRALHTIKGSASFLAITNLVNFAHAAEDALNVIRRHEVRVNELVMDALLRSVDVLRTQLDTLQRGGEPEAGPEDLIAVLHGIAAGRAPERVATEDDEGGEATCAADACPDDGPDVCPPEFSDPDTNPTQHTLTAGAETSCTDEDLSECAEQGQSGDCANPAPGIVKLDLGPSKSDLLGFMVDDLRESVEQLRGEVDRLENSGQRHEAGLRLAELAEGIGRTVEFFECASLVSLVAILEVVGEHIDDVSEAGLPQVLPRIRTVLGLLEAQCEHLTNAEVCIYDVHQLSERLVDLVLGHDLPADCALPAGASVDDVVRIDQVVGPGLTATAQPQSADLPSGVEAEPDHTDSAICDADADATEEHVLASISGNADDAEDALDGSEASIEVPASKRAVEPGGPSGPGKTGADRGKTGASASAGAAAKGQAKLEATIRVEVRRLEALQNLVGELVIQKNRLVALSRQVMASRNLDNNLRESVQAAAGDLDRVTSEIQVGVMRTRMQPLEKLFGKYPRLVRDLARSTGKKINLIIEGGDTEVDRSVLEELGDPLVHILRNSADHGIEPPAERIAAGKPEIGRLLIAAEHQGGHVVIRVRDDGRGLSRARISAKAVERGLMTADELSSMSDREVMNIVMMAGFSTVEKVSDLSGRGVGMDVVRTNIQSLGGQVELESAEGQGTTLTIKIPLTIAIMNAMMVRVNAEMYAIPLTSILEIVRPDERQMKTVRGNPVMRLRDSVLPLIDLAQEFNIRTPDTRTPFAVVVGVGDQRAGLLVSHLIGQQEIVIKPLDEDAKSTDAISGATVRDDGGVSLILDVARLIEGAAQHSRQAA